MKLYRRDSLIYFEDGTLKFYVSIGDIDISVSPTGSNVADLTLRRINGIVKRTKAVSEIEDRNGDTYGTTVQDLVFGIYSGQDINIIDSTTDVVIALFNRRTNSTTLASQAVIDERTLIVDDATGIVAGKYLFVFDGDSLRFSEFFVISVASTTITVDRLIDFAYASGSSVDAADTNMNVDGSVTPITFGLRGVESPEGVELTFNLRRLLFVCETGAAVDLNKFGDIVGGITNGLLFRTRDNGARSNKFSPKTNGGLAALCYDWAPLQASHPSQGIDGFIARLTFSGQDKMGSVIDLPLGSDAEFIIQDDLTSLVSLIVVAEGNIKPRK